MLHGLLDPLWAKQTELRQRKSYTQKHFQRDKPTISGIMSEHLINIYLSLERAVYWEIKQYTAPKKATS